MDHRKRTTSIWMNRAAAVLATGLGVAVAMPMMAMPANAAPVDAKWTKAKVVRWVDGDTVVTTKGRIRLIGVDTPEKGRCGSARATKLARWTAPIGSAVRLGNPPSVDGRDRYNRKLRYVVRKSSGVDIAARQIRKGSKARYDSADGYQWHPRQGKYRKIDRNNADFRCSDSTR